MTEEFKGVQVPQEMLRPPDAGKTYPPEPAIGKVITYKVQHGATIYSHASLRAEDGRWYTTGSRRQAVTWQELCDGVGPKLRGNFVIMSEHMGFSL